MPGLLLDDWLMAGLADWLIASVSTSIKPFRFLDLLFPLRCFFRQSKVNYFRIFISFSSNWPQLGSN